jgi:DNA-binding transcriptional regulator YhcF (GntR family)
MPESKRRGRPPGPIPRYQSIVEDLTRRFDAGHFSIGQPMPSCREFAREYDVGPKTIWLALKSLERDGRVQVTRGKKSIASRRVPIATVMENTVAIVMKYDLAMLAGIGCPPGIGQGIFESLSKTRTTCLILQDIRWWRYDCPQGLRDVPIKGILIVGPVPLPLLKKYESMGVPLVLIDQPADDFNVHSVTVDNYRAAFDATSRLIELGHSRIAFARSIISNLKNIDPDAKERQEGFIAACKKAGLTRQQYGIFSMTIGKQSTSAEDLLRARPRYTAVLSAGDVHAEQIGFAAQALGLKVPRDLSIVTFRVAHELQTDWSGPKIDFVEMGRIGTELLQSNPSPIQHVRFNSVWHEGVTLAPPRR